MSTTFKVSDTMMKVTDIKEENNDSDDVSEIPQEALESDTKQGSINENEVLDSEIQNTIPSGLFLGGFEENLNSPENGNL